MENLVIKVRAYRSLSPDRRNVVIASIVALRGGIEFFVRRVAGII